MVAARCLMPDALGSWAMFLTLISFIEMARVGLIQAALVNFFAKHEVSEQSMIGGSAIGSAIGSAPMEFQDGEFQFNCKFVPTFGDGTLDVGDWCGAGLHFGYFYYHHFGAVVLFAAYTDAWGSYPTCGMAVLQGVRNSVALKKIHVVAALKSVKK